jgi:hypothetical protein
MDFARKERLMKRLLFIIGLLGLLGVASACGGGGGKEVTLPGDGGNVKITTGGELPSDFPNDFPIFNGANLTGTVAGEQEGKTGYVATWETDASTQEVTDFYKGALDKDPWKTAGVFTTSGGALISFTRADNENFGGAVTISGNGKTQVAVFVGEGAGLAPTAEATTEGQPTPEKAATPEGVQTPTQAKLPQEVGLPNGYPADVAPIPDGARVIDASSFTTGGQTTVAVSYLTKEDPESIANFYSGEVPGNGWSEASRLSSNGEVFLTYENQAEGGELVVSVAPSSDYEGYTEVTLVLTTGG